MKAAVTVYADAPAVPFEPSPVSAAVRPRWLDFVELTKPRIGLMVLFTVAIGALSASPSVIDLLQLFHALLGTALVASGASALNQWLERRTDALMKRTENRPLPAGRLTSVEVVAFGFSLAVVGLAYMAVQMTHPLSAVLTGATFLSYVFVYTPLKTRTSLNTLIGAVPGALPPVIGWAAMTGTIDPPALVLFLIVFIWQIPHFLAIAWMYREDYARAGLQMLPVVDANGTATARQMLLYALALGPISFLPVISGDASLMYGFGAIGLSLIFVRAVLGFASSATYEQARWVLHASLIYLPGVLALLVMERFVRVWMT
ncbi:MAG: protoheme IX farnesyltransferase [Planctomycetes bacterium]|nr:protoheme IX farnesyltransferase [Planctomycetota bacterium]